MRSIYSTLLLFFLSVLFIQCQREISLIDNPVFSGEIVKPDPITATIQGNVLEENGTPAAGVTIEVGNRITITDGKGYFRFNDALLDKKSAVVIASKPSYFDAYRTFSATPGANQVIIKLIKKTLAGNIDATAGGDVSLRNGSKVTLPANGVVNAATNVIYTGQVRVYAAYIDPAATDISQTVPGSFMADNKDGKRVILTSYGMMAVELQSATGERLQIRTGSKARLTTAIPNVAQASSPATIPLWYVDETTGLWKEEGTATKNGNVYVGDVSHFSFWNCDVSQNAVQLTLTLKLPTGEPFGHALVRIKRNNGGWGNVSYGYSDSTGHISGYVPYNESLVLEILDQCNGVIYTQNIGQLTQNTNLGTITASNMGTAVVNVKGKLMSCSNTPVANGYTLVTFGNHTRMASVNANGVFETIFTRCSTSPGNVEIVGIDNTAQQQNSTPASVTVTSPFTDAGNISACGTSSSEYINYTLDGTSTNLVQPNDTINATWLAGGYTIMTGTSQSGLNAIVFTFVATNMTTGIYPLMDLRVNGMDSLQMNSPINLNLTRHPQAVGDFYEGNFSGQFNDQLNVPHTVSASFRLRRH